MSELHSMPPVSGGNGINTKEYICYNCGSKGHKSPFRYKTRHGFFHLQMRISFPVLLAKDIRRFIFIMRTCSFFYPLCRGYIHTRTRRRPVPSTCTTASSCNGDCGLHLKTSTVGTSPLRGGGRPQ